MCRSYNTQSAYAQCVCRAETRFQQEQQSKTSSSKTSSGKQHSVHTSAAPVTAAVSNLYRGIPTWDDAVTLCVTSSGIAWCVLCITGAWHHAVRCTRRHCPALCVCEARQVQHFAGLRCQDTLRWVILHKTSWIVKCSRLDQRCGEYRLDGEVWCLR